MCVQHLTPYIKYYSCCRAISYLFHWHKKGRVYKQLQHSQMDALKVDSIMKECLTNLKNCIEKYGELYCAHIGNGNDGVMDVSYHL